MEWFRIARSAKNASFTLLLFQFPLFAETTRIPLNQAPTTIDGIEPIEITLPTSTNPMPAPIDAKGKPIAGKTFPPLAPVTAAAGAPLQPVGEIPEPIALKAPPPAPTVAPAAQAQQQIDTEKPMLPPAAEAAVILSRNQFYPQRVHVPQGTRVRIWFTTVEAKPAALIVEGLKMQRWIASENSQTAGNSSGYFELQRELTRDRVTEITLQPSAGTYPFFDALSGARGEIVVE